MAKILKILVILSAFLLINAASCFAHDRAAEEIKKKCTHSAWPREFNKTGHVPFASYENEVLCISGGIFEDGVKEAIKILNDNIIKNVIIYSGGGEVNSSLDLAEEILNRDLDVYVIASCFSSCANYIFLAGKRKIVLNESVVAWHGLPRRPMSANEKPYLLKITARQDAFYARIGVDPHIAGQVPCDLWDDPEFLEVNKTVEEKHDVFWTYPKEVMEKKFHVSGIVEMWEPGSNSAFREFGMFEKVFLAKGCD